MNFFLLLSLCVFVFTAGFAKNKKTNPNIVFILADDMGYHGSYIGTPGISTPNIDHLASQGVAFEKAFSVCSSCSPSRSSILTGMFPHANGHWRNTYGPVLADEDAEFTKQSTKGDIVGVHDWVQTLPEILNKSGYYTAITTKFHLSFPYKYPYHGRYPNDFGYADKIKRIVKTAGEKPFFVQANIGATHRPFGTNAKEFKGKFPSPDEIEVLPYLPDADSVRIDLVDYYACCMLVDEKVGKIIQALKDEGVYDNTLIVFTSDHGVAMHRSKATAYYAGSHVPLIFVGNKIKEGISNKELVSFVDLLPTMLNYVGVDVPKQTQGQSLLPILKNGKKLLKGRDYIFTTHNSHGPDWREFYPSRAIFDGRYYLIHNLLPDKSYLLPLDLYSPKKPWFNISYPYIMNNKEKYPEYYKAIKMLESARPEYELYDMQEDAGQLNNVVNEVKNKDIVARLKLELNDFRNRTNDNDSTLNAMVESFGEEALNKNLKK